MARLENFLDRLPKNFRYGLEVRNKEWIDPTLLDLLRSRRVALVLVDISYMPHPADLDLDLVTTDFLYCRLIGDQKLVEARTDRMDRIVVDHSERLDRWAAFIRTLSERVPEAYVYANNHYAGYAPATIEGLAARVNS